MGAFLHTYAQRFLDQHVLTGFNRSNRGRDMELIGDSDDHRFHLGIGQEFIVLAVGHLGFPDLGHTIPQVIRSIADGVQASISSFLTALKMGCLGDHPAAQDADSHGIRGSVHLLSNIVSLPHKLAIRSSAIVD
jgi:hypothetical protein